MMENLFDALCSCLMLSSNRERFLKGEGLQLMNLMLRFAPVLTVPVCLPGTASLTLGCVAVVLQSLEFPIHPDSVHLGMCLSFPEGWAGT